MPRPKKCRKVCCLPDNDGFVPVRGGEELTPIVLKSVSAAVPVPKPVHPLQSLWFQKNCRRSSRKRKKLSKHFVA